MINSRLNRNLERKTKQRFILTLAGIILVLIIVVKYGIPFLINFSLFLSGSGQQDSVKSKAFIAAPLFSTDLTSTNSAIITITGSAAPKEKVKLYVNDTVVDDVDTKDDGSFLFKDVDLTLGQNSIKAKAVKDNSESAYSDILTIDYENKAPSLSITAPADGQSFSKDQNTVSVTGRTDPNIKVTVNGFWAAEDDKGNYSYTLHLQNGDNPIVVVATDDAGNQTTKNIKVTYSQ